jgi:hypothetical protein
MNKLNYLILFVVPIIYGCGNYKNASSTSTENPNHKVETLRPSDVVPIEEPVTPPERDRAVVKNLIDKKEVKKKRNELKQKIRKGASAQPKRGRGPESA